MKTADKLFDGSNAHLLDDSAVDPIVMPLTLADVRQWWERKRSDIPDDAAIGYLFAALEYYKGFAGEKPKIVPARVRLYGVACGDGPFSGTRAVAGDYDCKCNQWGAVSIVASNGQLLGLRPAEFEPITWRENDKA